jgi:hypothetical protein
LVKVRPPQPVQLLAGVILGDTGLLEELERELDRRVGTIESRSSIFDFDVTDYYSQEMGEGLKRVFYSFRDLISPDGIVDVKLVVNRIEAEFAVEGRRRINIDPGYMDFYKIVLVSAKFMGQKIYLGKGVYADPTLYYDRGWKPYAWGFPDFKKGRYDGFLSKVRSGYKIKVRRLQGGADLGYEG